MLKSIHSLLPLFLVGCIAVLDYWGFLEKLDLQLLDSAQRFTHYPVSDDIVIIEIDEQSLETLGAWPWPRAHHAKLLNVLGQAEADVTAFDILFAEPSGYSLNDDIEFAKAIKQYGNVILGIAIQKMHAGGNLVEVTPNPILYSSNPKLGHVHIFCSKDSICRSFFLKEGLGEQTWPHLSLAIIEQQSSQVILQGKRPSRAINYTPYLIHRDFHNYILFPKDPRRYNRVSYQDVLNGDVPLHLFKNKTVLIGVTAAGLGDQIATPLGIIPGVLFQASAYQALKEGHLIEKINSTIEFILFFFVGILLILFLMRQPPLQFLILSLFAVIAAYACMVIGLSTIKIWIPTAKIIVLIMAFYPIWSWLKLQMALRFLQKRLGALNNQKNHVYTDIHYGLSQSNTLLKEKDIVEHYHVDVVSKTLKELEDASTIIDQQRFLIQQTLAHLSEAIILTNTQGQIILYNPEAEALLQINRDNNIEDLHPILSPSSSTQWNGWKELFQSVIESDHSKMIQLEVDLDSTDSSDFDDENKILYCNIRKADFIADSEKTHTIIFFAFTDITLLKKAEQARIDTLNFLSHDLRSPMVSILALIENIESGKEQESSESIFKKIKSYTEKNLNYSENILLLSKADSTGKETFDIVDMHTVIDSAYFDVVEIAKSKDIKINIKRTPEDCLVVGDANLLERVFINLLSNAIKYGHNNMLITISMVIAENNIVIDVSDTGPGIDGTLVKDLFNRFNRKSETHKPFGSGLGLFFVKKVVEKHSGSVCVHSTLGEGATFSVALPLERNKIFAYQ